MTSNINEALNYLKERTSELNDLNKQIKFVYISLCEKPATLEVLKKKYNCFWLIEDYYGNRDKPTTIRGDYKELEEFLNKLVKENIYS